MSMVNPPRCPESGAHVEMFDADRRDI